MINFKRRINRWYDGLPEPKRFIYFLLGILLPMLLMQAFELYVFYGIFIVVILFIRIL